MKHLLGGFFLAQASLLGWGTHYDVSIAPEAPPAPEAANFPYSPDQGWFVDPSYLLWMPFMENMDYGDKIQTNITSLGSPTSTVDVNSTIRVKKPEFEWSSGVRVGIGRYLPNHDQWDISAYGTYFYGEGEDRTSLNPDLNEGIAPNYVTDPFIFPMSSGSAHWHLNYFTVDLMLGRNYLMTSRINIHPYLGIRTTFQYQEFQNRYFLAETVNAQSFDLEYRHKGDNNYWGIGPRIGTHFSYYFASHWTFLGHLAASVMLGQQKLHQRADLNYTFSPTVGIGPFNEDYQSKDTLTAIRANLEGYIGIGWEHWMRNHQVRIAPSVMFEGAVWFAMNQLWNLWAGSALGGGSFTTPQFYNRETRKHGNLGLMGLTFNLQVDF